MKKIFVLLLTLLLALALAACGDGSTTDNSSGGDNAADTGNNPSGEEEPVIPYTADELNQTWGGAHTVEGNKLILQSDVDFYDNINIHDCDLTIDLNGHTINYEAPGIYSGFEFMFSVTDSTVLFTDSAGGGKITAASPDRLAVLGVFDGAVATVEKMTLSCFKSADSESTGYTAYGAMVSGGALTLNNVTLDCEVGLVTDEEADGVVSSVASADSQIGTANSAVGLYVFSTVNVTQTTVSIASGSVQGTDAGIYIDGSYNLSVSGGTVSSLDASAGDVTMDDLVAEGKSVAIDANGWYVIE